MTRRGIVTLAAMLGLFLVAMDQTAVGKDVVAQQLAGEGLLGAILTA